MHKNKKSKHFGNTLNDKHLDKVASSRLVMCSDLEVDSEQEELNIQTIKLITGGDVGERGTVTVSMIMFANTLYDYDKMWTYTKSDRTRRIVVIPSVRVRTVEDMSSVPTSDKDLDPLISSAIRIRAMYAEKPPMTLDCVLHSLFMAGADDALKIVRKSKDAPFISCLCGTHLLCRYFRVPMENMQDCLKSLCYEGVCYLHGVYAIADIEPIEGAVLDVRPTLEEKKQSEKEKQKEDRQKKKRERTERSYKNAASMNELEPWELF